MHSLSIPDSSVQHFPMAFHEAERMAALRRSGLLDSPPEEAFDRLTRLAARLLHTPVAMVSLVDADRQFLKSQVGLSEPWASARQTPLTHSFCKHVVEAAAPLIVEDARTHPLVRDNLAVRDLRVVAYAGVPLLGVDGHVVGSFAVIDHEPRTWSPEEVATLTDLAASTTTEIGLRTALRETDAARAEVQRKEQRLQHALEVGRLGAWEVDLATELLECTGQCRANFGLDEDAPLTYRDLLDFIHPDDREQVRARVLEAIEQRTDYQAEYRTVWRTGEVRYIAAHGSVTYDSGGKPVRITGTTQDVTEQVRTRQELEALSRAKSEFLAVISHELRTPLTAIMAYSDLLRMGIPETIPQAAQLQVGRIDAAARHLLMLIEEILTFSRLEAGKEDVRAEVFSLREVIGDAAAFVRPVAEKKGLTLAVGPFEDVTVVSDQGKVRQILINLLSNAVKFTDRGEVGVRTEIDHGVLRIAVRDTGIGITPDNLRKIFEPFWQVAQPNTRTVGGTGLGLSVSRRIAELIGGELQAESTPEQGSVFTLVVPLRQAP